MVSACSSSPRHPKQSEQPIYHPNSLENACSILDAHPTWRDSFHQTYVKYGVPLHVVMAFIYQESRFKHNAKAKTSSAYGYAQAKTTTWQWYQEKSGHTGTFRNHLPHAVDFVGWYVVENQKRAGVSKWDAKNQYFAYHEGMGGFLKKTHLRKPWLLKVGDKVAKRATMYRRQLAECYQYPAL